MRLFFCFLCLWAGTALPVQAQALKWIATAVRSKTPKPTDKPLYGEKQVDLKPVLVEEKPSEPKPAEPQNKKEPAPKKPSESTAPKTGEKVSEKTTKKPEPVPAKSKQSADSAEPEPTPPAKKEPVESSKKPSSPKKKEPVTAKKKGEDKKPEKKTEPVKAVKQAPRIADDPSPKADSSTDSKADSKEPEKKSVPETPVTKAQLVPGKLPEPAAAVTAATPVAPAVAESAAPIPGAAVFRSGDAFELRLSGMPAEDALPFALQFTIGTDGFVNIPLGGLVRAAGLTQSQLESAIEKRLVEKEIFTRPTATINVAPQSRFVTVGGQVRVPQRLPWTADLTLLSAISAVGGPADFAGGKIKLTRGGKVEIFTKKDLDRRPEKDPRLLPGDQIEQL